MPIFRGRLARRAEPLPASSRRPATSDELLTCGGAWPVNRINPLISLGKVRARQGTPGCWTRLDEAAAAADGSGEPQFLVPLRLALAGAYWLERQPDPAAREAEIAAKLFISTKASTITSARC